MPVSRNSSFQTAKLIIIVTVFIDVLGIGIVIPTLPIYVENLTSSAFVPAALFSIYSFFGFFASPVLGSLSDRYGRRPILLLSLLGTAIGWFIFSLGQNLIFIFLGRIIDGITSGNLSTAQSYLVDIAKDEKERSHNLGLIGASFGVGFIVGPALGALLSSFGVIVPFVTAGVLALLNTIAAWFYLPETNMHKDIHKPISKNPFNGFAQAFQDKTVAILLVVWLLFGLTVSNFQAVFTLYTHLAFGFDEGQNGWILALVGIIVAFNQAYLLRVFWLKRFKQYPLMLWSSVAITIGFVLVGIHNIWIFIVAMAICAFSQALLRVVISSEIAGAAPLKQRGEVIGITQSMMFLAAIIGPLIGGAAMTLFLPLPWFIGALYMVAALYLLLSRSKVIQKIRPVMDERIPQEEIVEI